LRISTSKGAHCLVGKPASRSAAELPKKTEAFIFCVRKNKRIRIGGDKDTASSLQVICSEDERIERTRRIFLGIGTFGKTYHDPYALTYFNWTW
jgi:hypothetical protein